MLILPHLLVTVIEAFAPMCSTRVFEPVKRLLVGAILAPGKRTITAVRRVMGPSNDLPFPNYHRVLSRARWSALRGGRILLRWLVRACRPALW
jgi:DDE superfamily endonuclease